EGGGQLRAAFHRAGGEKEREAQGGEMERAHIQGLEYRTSEWYADSMTMETGGPIDDGGISPAADPFALFKDWLAEAEKSEPNDANAMALATADASGAPNVRMVLL